MRTPPGNARLQPGSSFSPRPPTPEPGQWRSRGYMPHFDSSAVVQHISFHLADSLPSDVLRRLETECLAMSVERQASERRRRIGEWIDAGHGSCLLRQKDAAQIVQDALLCFDGIRYRLFAWVVMPNHVHVLVQTMPDWTIPKVVASWKSYTGRRLSRMLPPRSGVEPNGRVWHREYWDRFIRNEVHFHNAMDYIHRNPLRAGLVKRAEEWAWSSAAFGGASGWEGVRVGEGDARLEPGVPRGSDHLHLDR